MGANSSLKGSFLIGEAKCHAETVNSQLAGARLQAIEIIMSTRLLTITALCFFASAPFSEAQTAPASTIRMIDLNGDDWLDMIENRGDRSLIISLGLGDRRFEAIPQDLPRLTIIDSGAARLL